MQQRRGASSPGGGAAGGKARGQEAPDASHKQETAGNADEALATISAEIHEQVRKERDEYLESLQRLQAEFTNFRKRVLSESEDAAKRASADMVGDLLPVLDNFERALKAATEHDIKLLSEGVQLVYNQLREVLTKRGLCEVDAEGKPFDPNHHEAVLCRPFPGEEEGKVMEVLEKGYSLDDQVVRPAKVVVSGGEDNE